MEKLKGKFNLTPEQVQAVKATAKTFAIQVAFGVAVSVTVKMIVDQIEVRREETLELESPE